MQFADIVEQSANEILGKLKLLSFSDKETTTVPSIALANVVKQLAALNAEMLSSNSVGRYTSLPSKVAVDLH